MNKALTYQDVYLVPQYGILPSRSSADISVKFLGKKFNAPWIPANMESVINEDIAKWLAFNNYPYIMHRFGDNRKFLQRARAEAWPFVSISVGVKQEDRDLIKDIAESKCRIDWITIDIAHGHSMLMKLMIEHIKTFLPEVKIIAGNVATPEAVYDLATWGADAVKVGVGGGKACTTKDMTGFHVPMFTCALTCATYGGNDWSQSSVPLILDGGIRENGDIAKALVAARGVPSLVMAGSLFAACLDAPGENVTEPRPMYNDWDTEKQHPFIQNVITKKRYHGSASHIQKGERKHVEGIQLEIPCNHMTYSEKYNELKESLSSSVSYGGGKDLSCLANIQWHSIK